MCASRSRAFPRGEADAAAVDANEEPRRRWKASPRLRSRAATADGASRALSCVLLLLQLLLLRGCCCCCLLLLTEEAAQAATTDGSEIGNGGGGKSYVVAPPDQLDLLLSCRHISRRASSGGQQTGGGRDTVPGMRNGNRAKTAARAFASSHRPE